MNTKGKHATMSQCMSPLFSKINDLYHGNYKNLSIFKAKKWDCATFCDAFCFS